MLSTGIPQLQSIEDIYYLRDAFSLAEKEEKAKLTFRNLTFQSLEVPK